jgi:integrase
MAGWHAFRRGLASNLFALGADDITDQRVLRHAKVQVTRDHYIKIRDPKLEAAMERLSTAFGAENGWEKVAGRFTSHRKSLI